MKNKILVKLIVPELDNVFDIFIPVNEVVWKIERLIIKSVSELSMGALDNSLKFVLINKLTGKQYNKNEIVINTDIRNATELILLSVTI